MIESVHFKNYKVLRDATLPLGWFTLIVGPNGSGTTTALRGLLALAVPKSEGWDRVKSAGTNDEVEVTAHWGADQDHILTRAVWRPNKSPHVQCTPQSDRADPARIRQVQNTLGRIRYYSLDPQALSSTVQLQPNLELDPNGINLVAVMDQLRDRDPERFEAMNVELHRWLPEYDRVMFDTPASGQRAFGLRTSEGRHVIPASELSQGTLLSLAFLTLAYLPQPPSIICLEEPDRGIHPRLLRDVQESLYRLSYPQDFGESRSPVQVIATTHSPYMVDLFRDHPEEVVIAEKTGLTARFRRLSDLPDLDEILRDTHLGDAWYTGILGGAPANT